MKKIAAPRPLKRSGVVPTTAVRNNLAVAQMYFRDDDDEEVEVESSMERNDHGDLLYSALTNSYRYAAHHLDNESIEMEGSCEIQRIFLSGLHTPGPRGGGGGANDEDDEGDRDSRLYFLGDPRASPSFQFFIPPPTRSGYDGNEEEEEEEEDHDASSYGISRDFPLLGHSPYEPLHRPNNNNDDDDDEASYFQGYHHYPRAANPMPLNTPFHAALANDAPLYESQHLVVGARGQFFTLPSGGHTRLHKGDAFPQQQQQHLNWEAAEEASFQGAGDTNRTTRNRSYSEPIPFVPAATPTRS